jgi:2-dehydro-3-deoxygluconokinase
MAEVASRGSRRPVVALGECMVELTRGPDGRYGLAFGGDTFNTSVYLARAGAAVAYATRLGDDPYSAGIRDLARREGIDVGLVGTATGRMPGLYLIEIDGSGERSFWYWRDRSPARELLDPGAPGAETVLAALAQAPAVYLSGVTLSLYSPAALDRLAAALVDARANGGLVVMDSNFRPRGWAGDVARARATFERFWCLADVALPTFDDEQALWGDASPQATLARLAALGVGEIAVKVGAAGAHVALAGTTTGTVLHVPCPAVVTPVDTTAAGDAFNAAYLAARLAGASPAAAALAGHRLAAVVIAHRGAIVPPEATAALFD